MSGDTERIGGLLSVAEGKFVTGELSREDFICKLLVVADDAQDANEGDVITDGEDSSLRHELHVVMEKFGITYEESGLAV